MRARKLSLAQAHPSQVVKVEVDAASQYIALVLHNASCLVYSSLAASSSSPSLVVSSCSDVCFLRLRQRGAHLSSSSSSDKSAERYSGSDHRKISNAKGKSSMHSAEGIGDPLPRFPSLGSAGARSADEVLLFLALKPGRGGACVDLLAWRCNETDVVQTPIFVDCSSNDRSGCLVARLDDISHGISARLLASINIVTVYSPANETLWIFSAKESSRKSHGLHTAHTERDQNEIGNNKHANKAIHGLLLVKSAVVNCNGPVYAMWLSMQHLLVGQLGGVRVWQLRPLIKGSEAVKSHLKTADNGSKSYGSKQDKTSPVEEEFSGKTTGESVKVSNISISALIDRNESVPALKVGCTMPASSKNGFPELIVSQSTGINSTHMNGYGCMSGNTTSKKQFWGCNGKSLPQYSSEIYHACTKPTASLDMHQNSRSYLLSNPVLLEAAGIPRCKDGSAFDSEELKSQQKFSQISMFSSCSDSSSSIPHLQTNCPRSASCQSLASSLSSVAGATGPLSHKSEFKKGTSGVFIAFQKGHSASSGKAEQVIKIHGLSEKDYLVLDSIGKLHLLTLQYVMLKDEPNMHQAQRVSLNAYFQHLWCGIRIKYISAAPDFHNNLQNPDYALRKLWVSDGGHTLYIVTIPPKEHAKEDSKKTNTFHENNLTVIGTVFLMERACSIYALDERAVLVQTEGSMLEYSNGS